MNDYTPPPGYTPTDDEVQADFLNMGVMRDEENAETLDRWYRWLAEHDRQVKAEAWAEAIEHVEQALGQELKRAAMQDNPYLNGDNVRLHALMRLLVSEGHMTPMAVRQISKIIPKPPISSTEEAARG